MTKKQAIEILNAAEQPTPRAVRRHVPALDLIEALDRAGAFQSEEQAFADISRISAIALNAMNSGKRDNAWSDVVLWRNMALRLATACRAAGLVKP